MGGGLIFSKNLRASLFNDDLSKWAESISLDSTFNFN